MPLTTKQRQYLKGLGHSLKPVIQVGKEGLTDRVIASISKALLDHELIKINILETALLERNEAAEEISTELKAEIVQILGRKVLLYRKNPEKAKIQLPEFFNKK
ncbi:MAG: ribosome assembly RNA-binding protein YhbY [Fibrobacter sp.]|nr:ribosome assembly RNA-binding protein YhbY [Fibrobacter sp.]